MDTFSDGTAVFPLFPKWSFIGDRPRSSFYRAKDVPGRFAKLAGAENFDKIVEIDQSPIGRTPRSNPATYVGFFSEIRELFAKTEAARAWLHRRALLLQREGRTLRGLRRGRRAQA